MRNDNMFYFDEDEQECDRTLNNMAIKAIRERQPKNKNWINYMIDYGPVAIEFKVHNN